MNAWGWWPYRLWVVGGMIGVVAFAIAGSTADPADPDFILTLLPAIAVYVAGIFVLQWVALRRDLRERPDETAPLAGLLRWNIVGGAALCVAIFAGVYLLYRDPPTGAVRLLFT